jgi:hypothetical protein
MDGDGGRAQDGDKTVRREEGSSSNRKARAIEVAAAKKMARKVAESDSENRKQDKRETVKRARRWER